MQREKPVRDGSHRYCDHIMESALELSEDAQWDPDSADLQSDEERYTETRTEVRNGRELTIRRKGVRPKTNPPLPTAAPQGDAPQPIDLNAMSDADLETLAARVGVQNYPKQASKAKRVAAVREAMQSAKGGEA